MAARTCTGVAVVGKKNDAPTSSFSHWTKYSTPLRVSTRMVSGTAGCIGLAGTTGFALDRGLVFALRERRFVDANYVSIKDVATHGNTAKPTYGSCANTCGM
jgi:hypothetical protein